MATHLQKFRYDSQGTFRGWLHTVTKNALNDYFSASKRKTEVVSGGSVVLSQLHEMQAREDLLQRLQHAFDMEVVAEAFAQVRRRVTSKRWQAFEMMAVQGLSGNDVAAQLAMPVASVYTAKSQVQEMVRNEIAYLETGEQTQRATAEE